VLVGYSRTSSLEQVAGFEAQIADLNAAGVEKMFKEQVSSVGARAQLEAALDFCREGDTLVVTKLDRLARSVTHLWSIVERLQAKGVAVRILNMNLDTQTPTGRLMLNVLAAVAEFERGLMLERQKEGIEKVKREGKYKGRAPTARQKATEVRSLVAAGVRPSEVARRLAISRASVYRILDEAA
jgi:DNA invertase Pin-like site-specific DNA recombinase